MALRAKPRALAVHARSVTSRALGAARTQLAWATSRGAAADLAVFHQLLPPPTGGGSQFLRALIGDLRRRGLTVEMDRISGRTSACLFNSYNFDARRLRRFSRVGVRMVHRVDGPIGTYRGSDDRIDRRIAALNAELADATVFQSRYSLDKHHELGLELVDPVVIRNAPDPSVFYGPPRREPLDGRRVRVVAASWSDNPRKGADALQWLDEHLDGDSFEVTFVGRAAIEPRRIRLVPAVPSADLAQLLRNQDLYLAASWDDPCSNALLEALACGLPAVFRRSGGHPELVGSAGVGFDDVEELGVALERAVAEIEALRTAIEVPRLVDIADSYLEVLGR